MKRRKGKKKYAGYGVTRLYLIYIGLAFLAEIALLIANEYIGDDNYVLFVSLFALPASAVVATLGTLYVSRRSAKGTIKISAAINKVAEGDFDVRIEPDRSAGEQFNELYVNFNKMAAELSSVKTLRDDYVHNFSHEIKTPIAAINGYAKLLAEGSLSAEEQAEIVQIIINESERLSHMSQNILLLSKLENQQVADRSTTYRLDLQIKDCIILLAGQWEKKKITITSSLPAVEYTGDERLVQQIWVNLLSNAIKFTPEGGEITVTLCEKGGAITAVVADNGIGMTDEQAARAFDKYYQVSAAGSGSGLGLAICKRICELVGGEISVRSKSGEGTAFTVTL